jgi:Kelch motif
LITIDLETGEPEYLETDEDKLKATPRAYHKSVTFGSKIIIFGGIDDMTYFNDYYTFNTIN